MGKKNKDNKINKTVIMTKDEAIKVVTDFASSGNAVILIDSEGNSVSAGLPKNASTRQKLLFELATKHLKFLSYAPEGALKAMLAQTESALDEMANGSCGDPDCDDCGIDKKSSAKSDDYDDDDDDSEDGYDIIFEPELKLDTPIKRVGRKKMQ